MSGYDTDGAPEAPAGWYPDPHRPGAQRYWTGSTWTAGAPSVPAQPLGPGPRPVAPGAGARPLPGGTATVPAPAPGYVPVNVYESVRADALRPAAPRSRVSTPLAVGVVLVYALAVAAGGALLLNGRRSDEALRAAVAACQAQVTGWDADDAALGDGGQTLTFDGVGKDEGSGTQMLASYEALQCLLGRLGTPDAVRSRMEATRALDGTQTAAFDGYALSWTYHPDAGLDLVVTRR